MRPVAWLVGCLALALFPAIGAAQIVQNVTIGNYTTTFTFHQNPSVPGQWRVVVTSSPANGGSWNNFNVRYGPAQGAEGAQTWEFFGSFDVNNQGSRTSGWFTYHQGGPEVRAEQGSPNLVSAWTAVNLYPLQPQTVTTTLNGANEWVVGQSKSGTATGAQGGNTYNFAIVSGQASIAGNSTTGAFTITANGPGPIEYKVWASAGGGYARSNDAGGTHSAVVSEAQSGDPGAYKSTKPQVMKNTYAVPVTVTYKDDVTGEVLMTRTLQPGETLAFTLQKQGNNPVSATFKLEGDTVIKAPDQFGNETNYLVLGGNEWTATIPDSEFSQTRPEWEAPATVNTSVPPSKMTAVQNPPPSTPVSGSNTGSTVVVQGNAGAVQYSTGTATGGATDSTLREGVGAIVSKLGDLEKQLGKSGPGVVNLNATGIESRIDTSNAHLDAINQKLDAMYAIEQQREQPAEHNAIAAAFTSQVDTVTQAVQQKFQQEWGQNVGDITVAQQSVPSGGGSWPTFTVPLLGEITLDPENLPWMITVLNCVREIVLWLLVAAFIRSTLDKVNDYALQVATVPQVGTTIAAQDMVPVAGQFFSWFKGGITAVAIISFVVVAFGLAIGVINTNINFAGIAGGVAGFLSAGDAVMDALGPDAQSPFWRLCAEFFPLGAFLSLITAEAATTLFMAPIFLGASFIVRAIRA